MSPLAEVASPVAEAVHHGLLLAQKTLPPWLFYDDAGSKLFEQITELPEYYLTRTERALIAAHSEEILSALGADVTMLELGAGTASKTGILLRAAAGRQSGVLYQPVDVSASALAEAQENLESEIPGITVRTQIANYVTERVRVEREQDRSILALSIGSSIGNFSPEEATAILSKLRSELRAGDALLLGTDLAPSAKKSVAALVSAYDDAAGVTAAFNLNMLAHINREAGMNFELSGFAHRAVWNERESRMEMHLVAKREQSVNLPGEQHGSHTIVPFAAGETIHTENSYKFTREGISVLLDAAGFKSTTCFEDADAYFALTLAEAV